MASGPKISIFLRYTHITPLFGLISDAHGSNDVRGGPLDPTNQPPLRMSSPHGPPKGATTVNKFFVLWIFELSPVLGSTI